MYLFLYFLKIPQINGKKYKSKRGKAVAAKGQAALEGWSVQQTKKVMVVELFLEGQTKWEEDSPH